jgi:hypothetical protein
MNDESRSEESEDFKEVNIFDDGSPISLTGQSGETYEGRIYAKGNTSMTLPDRAIILLLTSGDLSSVYDIRTALNPKQELAGFNEADSKATHIIIVPKTFGKFSRIDILDDLKQQYLN